MASCKQITRTIPNLLHPLADLDRVVDMVRGDLLGRLAYTDRFKDDPGYELGNVGAALEHCWEPLSGTLPRPSG